MDIDANIAEQERLLERLAELIEAQRNWYKLGGFSHSGTTYSYELWSAVVAPTGPSALGYAGWLLNELLLRDVLAPAMSTDDWLRQRHPNGTK